MGDQVQQMVDGSGSAARRRVPAAGATRSRRTAWAMAFALGVTFLAAVVATAVNVGILGFRTPSHPVGQVSAVSGLPTASAGAGGLTGPATSVVVQYQDVYVTDPAPATGAVATPAVDVTGQADQGASAYADAPAGGHEHESEGSRTGEHEREDDDD